jgi:murein DD-endopeptidase MepM/ murein hydrolase activator NlpD
MTTGALVVLVALVACSSPDRASDRALRSTAVRTATAATTAAGTSTKRTSSPTFTTPASSAPSTTAATISAASTTSRPAPIVYRFPVEDVRASSYGREHHDYPATDIFSGCGATVVAPTDGVLLEVRRQDQWSSTTDNPATRGGRSVSLLGRDGVRYYFAHFDTIDASLQPGSPVTAGQALGGMGRTGRASGCHLHFAISPPCPGKEWSVRRGVIPPWRYLDAWRRGDQLSPVTEVQAWAGDHPDACRVAMADPDASAS